MRHLPQGAPFLPQALGEALRQRQTHRLVGDATRSESLQVERADARRDHRTTDDARDVSQRLEPVV
jgi:hypothetical protein